jgi:hypothetical protein
MEVQSQIMMLKAKVYDRTFLICIQDTIEGVDDIGYTAVL